MTDEYGCVSVLELLAYAVGFDATTHFNECQIFTRRLRVLFQLSSIITSRTFVLFSGSVVEFVREPATESRRPAKTAQRFSKFSRPPETGDWTHAA
jgi:hypothetical protein